MPAFSLFDMTRGHKPLDPDFESRIRASFARQGAMKLIGARLARVEPGFVEVELPFRPELTQQHGYFHAGMTSIIADTAAGYAAYSLFPADSTVLTVEFKINFVAPARGERLLATGWVIKRGRTLTPCQMDVAGVENGVATVCAAGLATMMCLAGRRDDLNR